ncbi:MAG: ABC transporter ATP-binding protein [Aeromicrobium erythreum]
MTTSLAVDADGLTKSFGAVRAVSDVSLQVETGEVYGILGPNGAGKTTMLRMLFGLIRPDAGSLSLFGRRWSSDGIGALDGVGGFIESPRFYPYLSGRQNLRGLARLDGGVRPWLLEEVLDLVDLGTRADRPVGGWSYGMKQRLGVAASLLREPRLLVLDEPANGLDPAGIRDMRDLVKRLAAGGLTVLLSSHHMEEVEEICDNVTIMSRGSVAFHGSLTRLRALAPDPGHLLRTSDDELVRRLAADRRGVEVTSADGALRVVGPQAEVAALVGDVVAAGAQLRAFVPTETPLEALFFMLTDTGGPAAASSAGARQAEVA